jgi:serine/threonine-protein kinase HipA
MLALTLQIHHNARGWLDAAVMTFVAPGRVRLEYDVDYAAEFLGKRDRYALSIRHPVDLTVGEAPMPAFVLDLVPQGEPLKRILARYGLTDAEAYDVILARVPLAPPGNIRVKEPWDDIERRRSGYAHAGFTRADITERKRDFLTYMEESGAPIGGTSGAGGGSPKFMLREDRHGRLHAEGWLDDADTVRAYLVKLPYSDSENARRLARVEKLYYDVLRTLPVDTGAALAVADDTLFITRFDRVRDASGVLAYHGLESLYSANGVHVHGAPLRHEDNIALLADVSTALEADVVEYLKRDLLNHMLANTDNHGRNTSLLKKDGEIRLSPLYDVTAMQFFTGELITERTRWDNARRPLSARVAWVAEACALPPRRLVGALQELAEATRPLSRRLLDAGVPKDIVDRSAEDRDRVQKELEAL